MADARNLTTVEIADARAVFGNAVRYGNVQISNLDLGGAVTLAGRGLLDGTFHYQICWGPRVYQLGVRSAGVLATFIHEMTHVWQGENGMYPTFYMGQSIVAQLHAGIGDAIKKRDWRGFVQNWGEHRSTAYGFSATDIGRNWNSFNVEQQASIIESWFIAEADRRTERRDFGPGVTGGGASATDARFPYVRDVIRGRDRNAAYLALAAPPSTALAAGGDREIKALQDKLVALGYLDSRHADGLVGRTQSATLDAVQQFQQRNGLRPDRDLGGLNSATRRKLALPLSQLVRAR